MFVLRSAPHRHGRDSSLCLQQRSPKLCTLPSSPGGPTDQAPAPMPPVRSSQPLPFNPAGECCASGTLAASECAPDQCIRHLGDGGVLGCPSNGPTATKGHSQWAHTYSLQAASTATSPRDTSRMGLTGSMSTVWSVVWAQEMALVGTPERAAVLVQRGAHATGHTPVSAGTSSGRWWRRLRARGATVAGGRRQHWCEQVARVERTSDTGGASMTACREPDAPAERTWQTERPHSPLLLQCVGPLCLSGPTTIALDAPHAQVTAPRCCQREARSCRCALQRWRSCMCAGVSELRGQLHWTRRRPSYSVQPKVRTRWAIETAVAAACVGTALKRGWECRGCGREAAAPCMGGEVRDERRDCAWGATSPFSRGYPLRATAIHTFADQFTHVRVLHPEEEHLSPPSPPTPAEPRLTPLRHRRGGDLLPA